MDQSQEPYPVALLTSSPNRTHVTNPDNNAMAHQHTGTVADDAEQTVIFASDDATDNFQLKQIPESVEIQPNEDGTCVDTNDMPQLEKEDDDVDIFLQKGTLTADVTAVCGDNDSQIEARDVNESELPILIKIEDLGNSEMEPSIGKGGSPLTGGFYRRYSAGSRARLIRKKQLSSCGFHSKQTLTIIMYQH